MNLDESQVLWVLGKFPTSALPELGAQMMAHGHQGPSILELASFHNPDKFDISPDLVEKAFVEAGRPSIDKKEAVYRLVDAVLWKIVEGTLRPAEGGIQVYKTLREYLVDYPEALHGVVGPALQWEEDDNASRRTRLYERRIVAGAISFLKSRGEASC